MKKAVSNGTTNTQVPDTSNLKTTKPINQPTISRQQTKAHYIEGNTPQHQPTQQDHPQILPSENQ